MHLLFCEWFNSWLSLKIYNRLLPFFSQIDPHICYLLWWKNYARWCSCCWLNINNSTPLGFVDGKFLECLQNFIIKRFVDTVFCSVLNFDRGFNFKLIIKPHFCWFLSISMWMTNFSWALIEIQPCDWINFGAMFKTMKFLVIFLVTSENQTCLNKISLIE